MADATGWLSHDQALEVVGREFVMGWGESEYKELAPQHRLFADERLDEIVERLSATCKGRAYFEEQQARETAENSLAKAQDPDDRETAWASLRAANEEISTHPEYVTESALKDALSDPTVRLDPDRVSWVGLSVAAGFVCRLMTYDGREDGLGSGVDLEPTALKNLVVAARDGRVRVMGRPIDGGNMEDIHPSEFSDNQKVGLVYGLWRGKGPDSDDAGAISQGGREKWLDPQFCVSGLVKTFPTVFAKADADTVAQYKTGGPGQPSSRHLYMSELERRTKEGECEKNLNQEAEYLICWLKRTHPQAPAPGLGAMENAIRSHYNRNKHWP